MKNSWGGHQGPLPRNTWAGIRPDAYFTLRIQINGKRMEENLGWANEGMTLTKARLELARMKEAPRSGTDLATLRGCENGLLPPFLFCLNGARNGSVRSHSSSGPHLFPKIIKCAEYPLRQIKSRKTRFRSYTWLFSTAFTLYTFQKLYIVLYVIAIFIEYNNDATINIHHVLDY